MGKRLRHMAPAPRHLGRRQDMALGIARQQRAGPVKLLLLADTGQNIGKRTARRQVVKRIAGGGKRQLQRRRHVGKQGQPRLVTAITIQRRAGKNAPGGNITDPRQMRRMAGIGMKRRHDQQRGTGGKACQIGKMQHRRRLRPAKIALAEKHRQRFIAGAVGRVDNHLRPIDRPQPRAHHQPDAMVAGGDMRPHDSGKRVHVGDADGAPSQRRRRFDHLMRMRRPGKEAEIAVAAQHGQRGGHHQAKKPCRNQSGSSPRSGRPSR